MSEFLKQELVKSGLTQTELSERMDVTKQAVSSVMNATAPTPESVIKVLRALGWERREIESLRVVEVWPWLL